MTVRVAPVVSVDFRDFDAGFFQRIPDLACAPVNELGSQLNRHIALWIMNGEHSSTDPVACFHDAHRKTGAAQFAGRSQSSQPAPMTITSGSLGIYFQSFRRVMPPAMLPPVLVRVLL